MIIWPSRSTLRIWNGVCVAFSSSERRRPSQSLTAARPSFASLPHVHHATGQPAPARHHDPVPPVSCDEHHVTSCPGVVVCARREPRDHDVSFMGLKRYTQQMATIEQRWYEGNGE